MKTILVPTDFSDVADYALKFAIDNARRMNDSKVVLLNIIIPVHSDAFAASADVTKLQGATADRFNIELMRRNEERVEAHAEKFRKEFDNIEAHVRFNESETDLNHFVDEFHADLVVTGSENIDAFDALFFGRTEEKIMRKSRVPVITVKKDPGLESIEDIILAVDIDEDHIEGMDIIKEFSDSIHARLHLVYVMSKNEWSSEDAINKLDHIAHDHHLKNYTLNTVSNSDVEDGIRNFARKKEASLIAVFSEGKGKLHQLIFGNMAHELVRDADLPVLVSKLHGVAS